MCVKKESGIPKRVCKLEDIPGLREAGREECEGETTVKVEPSEVAKDASGALVKHEMVKSIFTENLQTSEAYCGREESLK
nr:histone acetyltransferase GCN5-like isoform X1 [Tanacetum cinerariifolium]